VRGASSAGSVLAAPAHRPRDEHAEAVAMLPDSRREVRGLDDATKAPHEECLLTR
jgi:hypothetical protein